MIRLPSLALVMDIPSPMPPKPPRSFCASSLKFQVTGSPVSVRGLLAPDISISDASVVEKTALAAPASRVSKRSLGACLLEEFGTQRLTPIRDRLDLFLVEQNFGLLLHIRHDVGRPAGLHLHPRQRLW